MKAVNRLVLGILAPLAMCGCPADSDDDDDVVAPIEQSEACEGYLECVLDVEPATVGELLESYGPDGNCWESQESADLCTEACEQAVVSLADLHPDSTVCASVAYVGAGPAEGSWYIETGTGDNSEMTIAEDLAGSASFWLFISEDNIFETEYSLTGVRHGAATYTFDMNSLSTTGTYELEHLDFEMDCDITLPGETPMECIGGSAQLGGLNGLEIAWHRAQ